MTDKTDVGDETQVKRTKKKRDLADETWMEDLRWLVSTKQGKRILWTVLSKCKLFDTISHHDALAMSRLSGVRDQGLWLLSELNRADPNAFWRLVQSSKDNDER